MILSNYTVRLLVALVLGLSGALGSASLLRVAQPALASDDNFNQPGNQLITDQFNNRVIEINPANSHIVWSFGSNNPTKCNPGPGAIIGPNDAERLGNGYTLMAGTGVPLGGSPAYPNFSCVDNRVVVVNHGKQIVWQYGRAGVTGSGPNELNVPVFAIQLPNHNFLITDQGNNRIIEVSFWSRKVVWSFPSAGQTSVLSNPNSAELLPNGHILIADENNDRAIEITRDGTIVWQTSSALGLGAVAFASRLPNGHTLLTDAGNNRVVEIDASQAPVFTYYTNTEAGSNANPAPTNAVRLANGDDTNIADQFNNRVLTVDLNGTKDFQYGTLNTPGNSDGLIDGPYTDFTIGDYTGQTAPPTHFWPGD